MRLENVLKVVNIFVGMVASDILIPNLKNYIGGNYGLSVIDVLSLSHIDANFSPYYNFRSHQPYLKSIWKRSVVIENMTQLNNKQALKKRQRQNRMLNNVRFAVQKVCLPLILIIGIPGNLFTLIILSRSHMKSSTNLYLAALAGADMCYLLFHFILSLQHYKALSANYWYLSYLVAGYPLTDMFSNASVWIVVSFTAERFLVIYNPIKGKVWCTVARAKRIVIVISLVAIFGTLPTFFERRVAVLQHHTAPNTSLKPHRTTLNNYVSVGNTTGYSLNQALAKNELFEQHLEYNLSESYNKPRAILALLNEKISDLTPLLWNATVDYYAEAKDHHTSSVTYILSDTKLFLNKNYQKGYFWFTSIFFCIFPLTLLCIFNSLLIIWIRKSTGIHKQLNRTWTTRDRQGKRKGSAFINNQETRITYMLIIVVLVFTLCQLPSAILLLAFLLKPANQEVVTWRLMNNFANLLVAIHACLNFVLYCLLSRKFRLTFSKIFLPCLKFSNRITWTQESNFFRDASQRQKTLISRLTLRKHCDKKRTNKSVKPKLMRQSISCMQRCDGNGHQCGNTIADNLNNSLLKQHSKHGKYSCSYEMLNRYTFPHIHQSDSNNGSQNSKYYKPIIDKGLDLKQQKMQLVVSPNSSPKKLTTFKKSIKPINTKFKNRQGLLCRIKSLHPGQHDKALARKV